MTLTDALNTNSNFSKVQESLNMQIESLKSIIAEKQKQYETLTSTKEWLFNFEGGGWNSVYAVTKEDAIAAALNEYSSSPNLNPNVNTFRVSTESDYKALLSLFY